MHFARFNRRSRRFVKERWIDAKPAFGAIGSGFESRECRFRRLLSPLQLRHVPTRQCAKAARHHLGQLSADLSRNSASVIDFGLWYFVIEQEPNRSMTHLDNPQVTDH